MQDLLKIEKMYTPKIITVVYWMMLLGSLGAGLTLTFGMGSGSTFFGGLVVMLVSAVFSRMWCELMIVFFRIHDHLKTIAEK